MIHAGGIHESTHTTGSIFKPNSLVPQLRDNLDWEDQEITTHSVSKGQNDEEFPRLRVGL